MTHRHEPGIGCRWASSFALAWVCDAACADELALLELVIDGRATQRVESFVLRDGRPAAKRSVWRALGVRDDPTAPAEETVSVGQLPSVRAELDLERRILALNLPPDPNARTLIDRGVPEDAPPLDHGSGALLNYDLSHQHANGRGWTSGLLEARWFNADGVLEHSTLVSDGRGAWQRRLNSTYTRADPQRLERLRLGDLVTGGPTWARPLRLGGVQLVTDFALRPGLVTAPTPQLGGNAAVPSTVDVLVNGARQLSEPVAPGRFDVRQLPLVNGLGEVSMVVRDALGRESVQNLSFYASSLQLESGRSAYAFEAGRVRRGFGTDDDRYGAWAASATWRRGLSDLVTFESHGEAGGGTVSVGAGALVNLGAFGLVGGALAGSQGNGRHGVLASVSAERQTPVLSLQLGLTAASAGYRDVASATGDAPLRHSLRLGAGWQLGRFGSVGVAAIDQRVGATAHTAGRRSQLLSATYQQTLPFGAQAYVSGYRDFAARGANGVSIGVTLPFGTRGALSSTLTHERAGSSLAVTAGESATTTGEFGWRAQADTALDGPARARQRLQATYLAEAARLAVETEQFDGRTAVRMNLQGAVLAIGGRLHASQTVGDSVAVVDVDGEPGVSVFHQNRWIGRTDRHGQIVVPGLLSFQANRLAIEPLDLPLDVDPTDLVREVRPADRTGLHVRFALDRQRAALVELRDAHGRPLPLGARVAGAGTAVVGHDGQAYLRGLGDDNRLVVDWGQGQCSARFAWRERQSDTGRIGPVACE